MSKYMGKTNDEIVAFVTADGIVDGEEASELRDFIYCDDGTVDRNEFNLVVAIATATRMNSGHSEYWLDLYVDVVSDYVFADDYTPRDVTERIAVELLAAWEGDGVFSECERATAEVIRALAEIIPDSLDAFLTSKGI